MGADDVFDDVDQLGMMLHDTKSFDKERRSTIADGRTLVEEFRDRNETGAWPSLDRAQVADRLLELIGPDSSDESGTADAAGRAIRQGSMNLCGPAAFFQFVIKRDPLMFAICATELFDSGTGTLGALMIAPGDEIRLANYAGFLPRMAPGICPQADWMVLGGPAQFHECILDRIVSWRSRSGIGGSHEAGRARRVAEPDRPLRQRGQRGELDDLGRHPARGRTALGQWRGRRCPHPCGLDQSGAQPPFRRLMADDGVSEPLGHSDRPEREGRHEGCGVLQHLVVGRLVLPRSADRGVCPELLRRRKGALRRVTLERTSATP